MSARHRQTEYKLDGHRSPSKGKLSHRKKKEEKKGEENRRIVPDDIHVIINLVCSRQLISAFRGRKDSHEIKLI